MYNLLFWLYLINSILLINHEIDSAYWKEWELFKIKGGITVFLIIHFPLLFLILYGLILVFQQTKSGLIFFLILSIIGIGAFVIHNYFFKKGRQEFNIPISKFILWATFVISSIELGLTIFLLIF